MEIFTRVKIWSSEAGIKKLMYFFSARKAADERWEVVLGALISTTEAGLAGAIPPVAPRAPAPGGQMVDNRKTPHGLECL
jgi:hypothetical protein